MFDWMLPEKHAIAILKKDHDTVKELFERFEKTDSSAEKEKIIAKRKSPGDARAFLLSLTRPSRMFSVEAHRRFRTAGWISIS